MFSTSLIFSTLIASLCAVSASAGALTATKPTGLVQCTTSALSWTGGTGPYDVTVYTGCESSDEDPIATFTSVTGNSVSWFNTLVSGKGVIFEVVDSTGASDWSDEAYTGGDASDSAKCAAEVKSIASVSSASVATASTTPSSGSGGADNAEAGPTFSGSIATQTPSASTNGAGSLAARPFGVLLGSVALGALAFL